MPVYKDTYGTWHITLAGRYRAASVEKLGEILTERVRFTNSNGGFRGITPVIGAFKFDFTKMVGSKLPDKYALSLAFASYAVVSGRTPIAWYTTERLDGGSGNEADWTVPADDYGDPTIRRHKNIIRAALIRIGAVITDEDN